MLSSGRFITNFLRFVFHNKFKVFEQLEDHKEALKAAFTYYVNHLDNQVAKDNLEYYLEITEENLENIENREAHVNFDFMLNE